MIKTKAYHREVWNSLRGRYFAHDVPPHQHAQINRIISDGIRGNWSKERCIATITRELSLKGTYHVSNGYHS